MSKKREKAEAFKEKVESKIQELIAEFSEGEISREQFNLLYDRYNGQLSIANEALAENDIRALKEVQNSVPTIFVKEATAGKATGMAIYHHRSGQIIEALGSFDIPVGQLTPTLNEILGKVDANEFVEPKSVNIDRGRWILFESRKHTTIITLFQNEPSAVQIREMQRLHHDFEVANRRFLATDNVDTKELAYPFLTIVQKTLKK
jgi:hypothetical protein